jgi:hypothetical protein
MGAASRPSGGAVTVGKTPTALGVKNSSAGFGRYYLMSNIGVIKIPILRGGMLR